MWTCSRCSAQREKPASRLPSGWKRIESATPEIFCSDCLHRSYMLRSISIPVSSVPDWKEFRTVLREMWGMTTQASNWMLTELYARDVRRNGQEKLPPMPRAYLYPETRTRFPQLPSRTCSALEQAVQKKYKATRYQLIWTCGVSLPTYRYPSPFPVPNQGWTASLVNDRIVVTAPIGDKRFAMTLRGGAGFHRQRDAVKHIISGAAIQGELALYEKGTDVMCKMVAWLPRPESNRNPRSGTFHIRTAAESLLVGVNPKTDQLWNYHADHIRRWSAEHRTQLQRWSDDQKAEHRPVPPFTERRIDAARKYRARMDSACHQVAALVAGYADRQHFETVVYDDSDHAFCEGFTWFRLRELIREKLDEVGIAFEVSIPATQPEETPSLTTA